MINLRKLRYFLAVVDRGSFSAAAVELGLSQPTLSQQVLALEGHLGQTLLLRTATGVSVTEAGRTFYRHARSLAAQIERAEAEVGSAGQPGVRLVSLGLATCGAAATLALPLLRRMRAEHPEICLRLNDNFAGTLSDFVMTGRIDLALAYTAPPLAGVNRSELFVEQLVVAAPPAIKLPGRRQQAVPLQALRGLPFALPSPIHFLRGVVDRACTRAGFEPRVTAEIDSLPALLAAVSSGLGVTVLPRAALDPCPPGLTVHRLGPDPIEVTVSLCTSAQLPVTHAIGQVGEIVTALVQERLALQAWPGVRAC